MASVLWTQRKVQWIIIAASLVLVQGCSTTMTMYADEQIRPYLRCLALLDATIDPDMSCDTSGMDAIL